jgi:hypothetical protein
VECRVEFSISLHRSSPVERDGFLARQGLQVVWTMDARGVTLRFLRSPRLTICFSLVAQRQLASVSIAFGRTQVSAPSAPIECNILVMSFRGMRHPLKFD